MGGVRGALWGALTAGIAYGIGYYINSETLPNALKNYADEVRALAHGVSGGALADAQGGKFSAGFYAAFFSQYANYRFGGGASSFERIARSAVIGGTASRLGGGKFENGAVTSAFQTLFNELPLRERAKAQGKQRRAVFFDGDDLGGTDSSGRTLATGEDFRSEAFKLYPDADIYNVGSGGVERALSILEKRGIVYDEIIFFDHGSYGVQTLGNDALGITELRRFSQWLSTDGAFFFRGCNVAQDRTIFQLQANFVNRRITGYAGSPRTFPFGISWYPKAITITPIEDLSYAPVK